MPIKLFLDGEILDASDVNTYFMDQSLVIFEDSDERDAAFGGFTGVAPNIVLTEPVLTEGRICYLKDDDTLYIYTGATWTAQLATIATGAVTSDKILNDTIMNVDINSAADIAHSKLATTTAGNILLGTTTTGVITGTAVTGDVTITGAGVTAIGGTKVTNAMLAGSIADTKLATIATAGKVSNSATTATDAAGNNTIVARGASGNFSAGTITAALTGNVTGNVTGSSGSCTGNAATATTATTVSNTSISEGKIDYTTVPKQTVSTSPPSGGKQHDIWIKVPAV